MIWSMTCMAQPQFTPARPVVSMGDIMFRTPRTVTFTFTNTGSQPLLITDVHPSCGCTTATYPHSPVKPGESGEIVATYDAAQLGVFVKELEVHTNASEQPTYLTFQGRVTTDASAMAVDFPIDLDNIRLTSNTVEFEDVNKGDRPVAELQILNPHRQAYKPALMHLPPYLSAEYVPAVLAGGRVGRILIHLDSEKLPAMGLNQTSIYLARFNGDRIGEDNEISVSAILLPDFSQKGKGTKTTAHQAPRIQLSADTLRLGPWGKRSSLSGTVEIRNTGDAALDISRLQVFNKALSVSLPKRTLRPGERTRLKIKVERKYIAHDKNRLAILLITNDPTHPKTIIDLAM